jgi:hypothetical protein
VTHTSLRKSHMNRNITYMAMEGFFHQEVCPNIDKNTKNDLMHVGNFQGRHFCWKNKNGGNAQQRRTGLVK